MQTYGISARASGSGPTSSSSRNHSHRTASQVRTTQRVEYIAYADHQVISRVVQESAINHGEATPSVQSRVIQQTRDTSAKSNQATGNRLNIAA